MQTSTSLTSQIREIGTSELSLPQGMRQSQNQIWENWGRTARCQPAFSFYPQCVEDLVQIVEFAREHGLPIRVAADGNSANL